ncbi:hypothetical protein [Brachybacterium sp. AG952]|uniref:hypothetical protein n=1 Tax=Brachybacterium sp. AG952 TaxID=2183989 RepID=UPI0010612C5A|nr:hypothetical protein [Brachybacterium sp. AG952]
MTRSVRRQERNRLSFGLVASFSGGAAIAVSMAGQFYAATDHAAAVNSGHPKADTHLIYLLAVAPSILLAVVALCLGTVACAKLRGARVWGAVGIGLGLLAVILAVLQFPAGLMAEHWIRPHPSDFR